MKSHPLTIARDSNWLALMVLVAMAMGSLAAGADNPTKGRSSGLSKESETALRARASELFAACRAGDIDKCLALSDPASIEKNGRSKAVQFFRVVSGYVRLRGLGADDHRIGVITVAEDGRSARVQTEVRLGGSWQPPSTELWTLVDGQWRYQETLKK